MTTRATRDHELAGRVRSRIRRSARLDATGVRVIVEDGVVHLRGRVRAFSARLAARELAGEVEGVDRVVDELEVRPFATGWRRSDEAVERSVVWALARDPRAAADVTTAVEQHVVTLRGTVPDHASRQRLRRRVERVRGVHFVHDELRIRGGGS